MKKRVFGWLAVGLAVLVLSPVAQAEETMVAEKNLPSIRGCRGLQVQLLSDPMSSASISAPDGFEVDSSSGGMVLSLQGNYKKFSLEVTVPTSNPKFELSFYGSSMGEIEVATSTITAKWYPYEWRPAIKLVVLPYLGLGQQYTNISGQNSMGGVTFPESHTASSWIWQGGTEISFLSKYTENLFVTLDYKSVSTDYKVQVPDGPSIKISTGPIVTTGVGLRF